MHVDCLRRPCDAAVLRDRGANLHGVFHEFFVGDFIQLIREGGAPVARQPVVGYVVSRQVVECITERVGFAEQRAVHGKAAVEGRAPHEEKLRVRQRTMNRSEVQIVHGELFHDLLGRHGPVGEPCIVCGNSVRISGRCTQENVSAVIGRGRQQGAGKILGFPI